MKDCPFNFFYNIHVKEKRKRIQQKMIKIGTFENEVQI
jgi:hypothetical protein